MKKIITILTALIITFNAFATDDVSVNIDGELPYIEVLTDDNVRVMVFSKLGDELIDTKLVQGINQINIEHLDSGEYTLVIWVNDVFTRKEILTIK